MQVDCSQVLAYLDGCRDEMLRLWETIVRLETPSTNPEAVNRLASHLDTFCGALGMDTAFFHPPGRGHVPLRPDPGGHRLPCAAAGPHGHRPSRGLLSRRPLASGGRQRLRPRCPRL